MRRCHCSAELRPMTSSRCAAAGFDLWRGVGVGYLYSAELMSACGRLINAAKETARNPLFGKARAGFFVARGRRVSLTHCGAASKYC